MSAIFENIYTGFIVAVISILAVSIVYLKWIFGYWKRRNVSTPPITFLFGNVADVVLQKKTLGFNLMDAYFDMKSQGLKFSGYYFFAQPILMVFDPDLIKNILTKDFNHFTDHGTYVNEHVDPLSGHLFALKGLKWRNLRSKLTPTFTSGKMKMMFQNLLDCSEELITVMDEMVGRKEDVDIKDIVARFTTDIIGSCAFGIECNSLKNPNAEFREYGKQVFELGILESIKNFTSICFPQFLDFFSIPLTKPAVAKFFMNAVKQTVKYREENNISKKDFMHLLIQLKNNVKIKDEINNGQLNGTDETVKETSVGKSLTIEEVAAQAFVFFIAGFETSSTTLTFCFYELVANLGVQDKLREEINTILEKHDGEISYDALMEMTYMEKCINETLRKYPPAPMLIRECTQAYQLPDSDLVVEKGTQIFIPIMGIQHDPEHYSDPEKFDPERFSPENISKRHSYTWLPFGEGPRACIGLRFGMMQAKMALTVLLKNYKFTLNPKTQVPLSMAATSFILTAQGGVWLNAEKL